ncbi:phosphoribosylamine--glycine ligase [Beijerinckia indica]|uniref:Phosphoribosylamine--glycine ligase n=1 Tax=Beijerinckia indica subsp. indica (strain ATCC 9039 / DSM 1715 / NCIMB 8712) TaxID=395963 RepID=B2II73_BEII9|nr:phosphoribosylamine--glycine ligase [Beijerinckia indica]ACB94656.1 phosphoribosylamine--glycine ligase [Beijerinckia indica subsp. indica ATCC 9039]
MNVLLIGSGGREHAIAKTLAKSPLLSTLFVAPGNPGMMEIAEPVVLKIENHQAVIDFCRLQAIGLVVIGPEVPLVAGLTDPLVAAGIKVFGPSQAAAQLEGSKNFTKQFCLEHGIPTAQAQSFDEAAPAKAYAATRPLPIVVKADGLAAGKGVVVAATHAEAEAAIDQIFAGGIGGNGLLIEDFLEGEEASFFALCDGTSALPFASAQDHKRVGEGDTGANTGGMGAYSPAPVMDAAMTERVIDEIITPTVKGMAARGTPFKGMLFAGLMIGPAGPKLIEYNVRFGDPETQVMLPRLQDDLLALLLACAEGHLPQKPLHFADEVALTVVLAAKGYPEAPQKGSEIRGVEKAASLPGVSLTHAGTRREGTKLLADGGRVLNVTGLGKDVAEARERAYAAVDLIDWPEGFCRHDIGWRALQRN